MAIRLAFRTLLKSRSYALTAIGTITLTIALGATVFAVVDGVLFKPLPYPAADRLFQVMGSAGPGEGSASLSALDVRYLADADPRIQVASVRAAATTRHPDRPDLAIRLAEIDPTFFDVLGQHPLVGGFTAEAYAGTSTAGAPIPTIVSHAFWQQWLGADPMAVGRTLDMIGTRLLILGVLPGDFVFPVAWWPHPPDLLVPLRQPAAQASNRWARGLTGIARLTDGVSVGAARQVLDAALASRTDEYAPRPRSHPGPYVGVAMRPLAATLGANERGLFRLAFVGAALIVLLGALNVTGLFAARIRGRARDLAIRATLGASRRQLAAVLLAEAAVVGLAGAGLGLLLARPALAAALALLPDTLRLLKEPALDWRVTVFGAVAAVVPLIGFCLMPLAGSVREARTRSLTVTSALGARVGARGRATLLAVETAIGLLLLLTGSLVLASFVTLRAEAAGFGDTDRLAIVQLLTAGSMPAAERANAERTALARLERMPGVRAIALVDAPLLERVYVGSRFEPPGPVQGFAASDVPVSAAFFGVTGLRVLDGRVFTEAEIDADRPLAVVSERTARAFWPNGRAVGQVLRSGPLQATVIGVVEEARLAWQGADRWGEIYVPLGLGAGRYRVHLVRTASDPVPVLRDAALVLRHDVPDVFVQRAESFDAALSRSVAPQRFQAVLFTVAGVSGLLLVSVGVAGLVATGVARRVREIGLRAALGARRRQLVRMIVVEHLRPAAIGLALGLIGSWWAARQVRALLYEVDAYDLRVWAAAAGVLLVAVLAAAWVPARRASAVDPMEVLRAE